MNLFALIFPTFVKKEIIGVIISSDSIKYRNLASDISSGLWFSGKCTILDKKIIQEFRVIYGVNVFDPKTSVLMMSNVATVFYNNFWTQMDEDVARMEYDKYQIGQVGQIAKIIDTQELIYLYIEYKLFPSLHCD